MAPPPSAFMHTYWVYLLLCADASIYIGVTNDISRRVLEHNYGTNTRCYTYKRRPVTCIHSTEFQDIRDAIAYEKRIKRWTRAKKLALSSYDEHQLKVLAHCQNQSENLADPTVRFLRYFVRFYCWNVISIMVRQSSP